VAGDARLHRVQFEQRVQRRDRLAVAVVGAQLEDLP
jgi:hypothetical protein